MNSHLPRITAKELIRFLKRRGFFLDSSKGSHQHFVNPDKNVQVTVPVHSGKIIGPGLLKSILQQAGLEWDEN